MLKIRVKLGGDPEKKSIHPKLKAKVSGQGPLNTGTKIRLRAYREPGLGYDSEASDREDDPYIEHQFILRMCHGEDLEYLRKAVEEKTIGNGADFYIKFKDNRRAIVVVNNHMYSAKMADLPCIIESSKTFDRKTIYKVADICQILLVENRIEDEETITANPIKHSEYIYPHGLTPPLRWVRKRRFRKRLSHKTIEMIEAEVARLLSLDAMAEVSSYDVIPVSLLSRESSFASENESFDTSKNSYKKEYYENVDTMDIESEHYDDADEDYLADQLEQAMMELDNREASQTPAFTKETETPQDDSGNDDNEDSSEEIDEETRWAEDHQRLLDDEIAELNATIAANLEKLKATTNPILQKRFEDIIRKLKSELDLKQSQNDKKI